MAFYSSREDKPTWIVEHFSRIFAEGKKVLDVGCDERQLVRVLSPDTEYVGLDISREADIQFDLDSGKHLPISDDEFDLVLAFDTLEHLEHIHFIFDELCRVSRKYILITLPNPISGAISSYLLGKRYAIQEKQQKRLGEHMKFYGLPLEIPLDRHRWFFNTEESIRFVTYRAHKNRCDLKQITYSIHFQRGVKRYLKFIAAGFSKKRMINLFNGTTIFLLEKKSESPTDKE